MVEQAKSASRPSFNQQLEPIFSELSLSQRSVKQQSKPAPAQPDFTQDFFDLNSSSSQPEQTNILAFRRAADQAQP